MRVATWTAAVVLGGGLAVLVVYWAVTVLTALFDSPDVPLAVKIAVPAVIAGGAALLVIAVLQRIRDRKREDLEGVEY